MLKLLKNNWAKCEIFKDVDGGNIDYTFIKKLYALQETEFFRFGTKLKKAHMEWEKQKMKVRFELNSFKLFINNIFVNCSFKKIFNTMKLILI